MSPFNYPAPWYTRLLRFPRLLRSRNWLVRIRIDLHVWHHRRTNPVLSQIQHVGSPSLNNSTYIGFMISWSDICSRETSELRYIGISNLGEALKADLMEKLNKGVKSLDEYSWMFDGPRSCIHLITRPEALCGFQLVLTHLDGKQLLIKSMSGEVVKLDSYKAINDDGIPVYQRPFMNGKHYIHFNVDLSESLSPDQIAALEGILPPKPVLGLTEMEIDECEETTMHDVNMELVSTMMGR